jgi:orotidine-5'-phosphate decarboxylase
MNRQELIAQINQKKSFLCIGLDVDLSKIPTHLLAKEDPIFEFNKQIIDATYHLAVAYKPNTAFYEAYGLKGWAALGKTIDYLNANYPEIFTIAPYMGSDSVEPFLAFKDKTTILLALTSNRGGLDFQGLKIGENELYKEVIKTALTWKNSENLMFVVGATKPTYFKEIRKIVPNHFLLVPGVGAQGGNLQEVCKYGLNEDCGLLINSSRGIIYAGNDENFAKAAQLEALKLQQEMASILSKQ